MNPNYADEPMVASDITALLWITDCYSVVVVAEGMAKRHASFAPCIEEETRHSSASTTLVWDGPMLLDLVAIVDRGSINARFIAKISHL